MANHRQLFNPFEKWMYCKRSLPSRGLEMAFLFLGDVGVNPGFVSTMGAARPETESQSNKKKLSVYTSIQFV